MKSLKLLTSLLVFIAVLGTTFFMPFTYASNNDEYVITKDNLDLISYHLQGKDKYEMCVSISEGMYIEDFNLPKNVVIVNPSNTVAGFCAVSLAAALDAPILYVKSNSIPNSVANELKRLKAENAYIVGSTNYVSSNVRNTLKNKYGLNVTRYTDSSRYVRAVKIANKVNSIKKINSVFIAKSTSSEKTVTPATILSTSAKNNIPLLYTGANSLNSSTKNFIKSNSNIKTIYVLKTGLNDNIINDIKKLGKNVEILSGSDFQINNAANVKLHSDFENLTFVKTISEAIPSSLLAKKHNSAMVFLSSKTKSYQKEFVSSNPVGYAALVGSVTEKDLYDFSGYLRADPCNG